MQFEKSSAKQGKSTRSRQKKAIDMPPDLDWTNAKNIEDALKDVHEVVTKRAHELIKYYDEAIPGRRIRAKAVRMAQLVLSGIPHMPSPTLIFYHKNVLSDARNPVPPPSRLPTLASSLQASCLPAIRGQLSRI